jgi:hypothetical protein
MLTRTAAPMMKQISRNSEAFQRVTNIPSCWSMCKWGAIEAPRPFDPQLGLGEQ